MSQQCIGKPMSPQTKVCQKHLNNNFLIISKHFSIEVVKKLTGMTCFTNACC